LYPVILQLTAFLGLSALLQLAIMITSLDVRWRGGRRTQWWRWLKSGNGRKPSDPCTKFFPVVPFTVFLSCF